MIVIVSGSISSTRRRLSTHLYTQRLSRGGGGGSDGGQTMGGGVRKRRLMKWAFLINLIIEMISRVPFLILK